MKKLHIICALLFAAHTWAAELNITTPLGEMLDSRVTQAPKMHRFPELDQGAVQAIYYETLPYQGKETRAFAYIGIPESEGPVPAMVLVHGGGGKAFSEWVKIWNDRGYAAISISLEGHMPNKQGAGKIRHEYSGPVRVGRFDDAELPLQEQWMTHAVSDVMLAHSLLRSLPEVDADRIGVTGISWGGILSSLVSGVDDRFKCAMPVYGAGFLYESHGHFKSVQTDAQKFWDPARHFASSSMPTLWVNGDSDGHFSVNITSHSFKVTEGHAWMTIHPGMAHGHPPGWDPKRVPEIYAFADQILKAKTPSLGRITQQPSGRGMKLSYESVVPVLEATVYYLNEPLTYYATTGKHDRPGKWLTLSAEIDADTKLVSADLPESCQTYYVNLKDSRGYLISSVLVELDL